MDVWFDSGTSWAGVVAARPELRYPADLYLEGSDQHRGWFQSSLLTSVAGGAAGVAPYKAVLTHGFVLDEKGFKMSKSLGNVIDPAIVIDGDPKNPKKNPAYGADALRLWVSSCDYSSDVSIGPNIIKQTSEQFRKVRNTLRYLLGNLGDVDAADPRYDVDDKATYEALPSLDKWLLGRLGTLELEVERAYDSFAFSRVYSSVLSFISTELSAFYLDVAKDRLYISSAADPRRVTCQATLKAVTERLLRMLAPIVPHTAEDAWQLLPYERSAPSVFESPWPRAADAVGGAPSFPPHLDAEWAALLVLRDDVNQCLEAARRDKLVGSSLDALVLIAPPPASADSSLGAFLARLHAGDDAQLTPPGASPLANDVDDLRFLLLSSQVRESGSRGRRGIVAYRRERAVMPSLSFVSPRLHRSSSSRTRTRSPRGACQSTRSSRVARPWTASRTRGSRRMARRRAAPRLALRARPRPSASAAGSTTSRSARPPRPSARAAGMCSRRSTSTSPTSKRHGGSYASSNAFRAFRSWHGMMCHNVSPGLPSPSGCPARRCRRPPASVRRYLHVARSSRTACGSPPFPAPLHRALPSLLTPRPRASFTRTKHTRGG